jgi:hypothetical protein
MTSETPALASRFKIVTDPDVSQQTLIEWALERMDPADLINMGPIGPARVFGILFDGAGRRGCDLQQLPRTPAW